MDRRSRSHPDSATDDWWWIFDPRISLRARAALIFGGSAMVFTLLFSTVASRLLQRSLERQLGATFETLAFQVSDKLDRVIHQRHKELQLTVSLAPFRKDDAVALDRRHLLDALQGASRDFAWIGFADTAGRIRTATQGLLENTTVDSRPWFLIGRERPYAGPLKELPALTRALNPSDESNPSRYLDLAVPVNADSGQFLGVLGAQVNWEWTREVQVSVVPESARRDRIGVTVYSATGEVLLDSGGSGWSLPPDAPAIPDARRFRGSIVENTSVGTTYLTGFARSHGYREYRGLGWLITVRQPHDLALAPARELKDKIAGWGFAFAGVLFIGSWLAAGRLARRISGITTAARRIHEGDVLTVLPRPQGGGELDRMCVSLDTMVEDLRRKPLPLAPENSPPADRHRPSDKSTASPL